MQSERRKRRERESVEGAIFAFLGALKKKVLPLVVIYRGGPRGTCFRFLSLRILLK